MRHSHKRPIPFYVVVLVFIGLMFFLNIVRTFQSMQASVRREKKNAIRERALQHQNFGDASDEGSIDDDADDEFDEQRRHNSRVPVSGGFHISDLLTKNENMHYADKAVKALFGALPSTEERRMLHHVPEIRLSIFVSVVSYRDTMCRYSLRSLFAQALNPGTIFVGVVEQHSTQHGDELCVQRVGEQLKQIQLMDASHLTHAPEAHLIGHAVGAGVPSAQHHDQITGTFELIHAHAKVMHAPPWFGKGPAHARYLAAAMYSDEAYFLMIDSHSVFSLHWDRLLIQSYLELAVKVAPTSPGGPVLTHHPPPWIPRRRPVEDDADASADDSAESHLVDPGVAGGTDAAVDNHQLPFVCLAKYDAPELGYPILYSTVRNQTNSPRPQPFVGAGLLFTKGEIVQDVPFDAHLDYLFHGEEILLSARLWTSGFDFFAPNRVILRHYYYRRESAKYNNDSTLSIQLTKEEAALRDRTLENSIMRVQYFLQTTHYLPPWERKRGVLPTRHAPENGTPPEVTVESKAYGLGTERTLDDFWAFCGIDPIERVQNPSVWCCKPDCVD
jgi:hypothetical protein